VFSICHFQVAVLAQQPDLTLLAGFRQQPGPLARALTVARERAAANFATIGLGILLHAFRAEVSLGPRT
jgi:hypothetical protein